MAGCFKNAPVEWQADTLCTYLQEVGRGQSFVRTYTKRNNVPVVSNEPAELFYIANAYKQYPSYPQLTAVKVTGWRGEVYEPSTRGFLITRRVVDIQTDYREPRWDASYEVLPDTYMSYEQWVNFLNMGDTPNEDGIYLYSWIPVGVINQFQVVGQQTTSLFNDIDNARKNLEVMVRNPEKVLYRGVSIFAQGIRERLLTPTVRKVLYASGAGMAMIALITPSEMLFKVAGIAASAAGSFIATAIFAVPPMITEVVKDTVETVNVGLEVGQKTVTYLGTVATAGAVALKVAGDKVIKFIYPSIRIAEDANGNPLPDPCGNRPLEWKDYNLKEPDVETVYWTAMGTMRPLSIDSNASSTYWTAMETATGKHRMNTYGGFSLEFISISTGSTGSGSQPVNSSAQTLFPPFCGFPSGGCVTETRPRPPMICGGATDVTPSSCSTPSSLTVPSGCLLSNWNWMWNNGEPSSSSSSSSRPCSTSVSVDGQTGIIMPMSDRDKLNCFTSCCDKIKEASGIHTPFNF